MIETGKKCRVKGQSKYFSRKYGTSNPETIGESVLSIYYPFPRYSFIMVSHTICLGTNTHSL